MTQPKTGEPDPPPPPPPDPPQGDPASNNEDPPENWDKDRAAATIKAQREAEKALKAENKTMKERLDALEKAEKDRREAEMSELEKANNRVKELEAIAVQSTKALREARLRADVAKLSVPLKIVDPDVVYLLLDTEKHIDADGNPTGVEDALKAIIKEKPYLVAGETEPPKSQHKGPPPAPKPDTKAATEEALKEAAEATRRMTVNSF